MSDLPGRKSFDLPPPPPPRVTRVPATSSSRNTQEAKESEPHASTASIPVLHSAPPSANLSFADLEQSVYPQKATVVALPLPPPPRARESSTQKDTATTSGLSSTFVLPLPPPPVMSSTHPKPALVQHHQQHQEEPGVEIQYQQEDQPPEQPLGPPDPLPPTAFSFKSPQLLAKRQTHIPILLLATEKAHQLAWKNGLLLQDMFEGLVHSMMAGLSSNAAASTSSSSTGTTPHVAPFRSASKFMHLTWKDIHVTFQSANKEMEDSAAAQLMQQQAVLHATDGNLEEELFLLEDQVDNLLQNKPQPQSQNTDPYTAWEERQREQEQVQKDAFSLTSPLTIPWLWRYRQALDISTDHLPHELFHCPPLALCICTTQEEDQGILETLQSLKSSGYYLPTPFQNGIFDANALHHEVLVLHDNVNGPSDFNETTFLPILQQRFGPNAAVLRINSISLETAQRLAAEEMMDLWGGHGLLGNCLSINDRVAIRHYLANLISTSLLPALERRVARLNALVSERKKGVRNVLKSFWRTGKTKEESQHKSVYKYDSIENQTRLLGDTLFLVTDYEGALGMYRLIKDDFKQDKAHAHHGGVQEMMAICLYLMDSYGRAREIFTLLEGALWSYSRAADEERGEQQSGRVTAAPKSTRLATRLCLLLTATTNICAGRHLEVADLLASASSNENALGAAVLLEQGSAHYFQANLYRKYAFHMLMSGHMFRTAEQDHHAFRCFTSALYIYRDGRWEELHNHLRSALAAQLYTMGRMASALQLYAKLVGSTEGSVSTKSQQKFVTHLLEICNEHPKKALAGADRMAAPSYLTGAERDAVRKSKLDRIVQVVRYTKSAVRVLELRKSYLDGWNIWRYSRGAVSARIKVWALFPLLLGYLARSHRVLFLFLFLLFGACSECGPSCY
jgi:hypothetical protein